MAATPIATITKYVNPGTTKVYWVPAISNTSAPTRSELNAGTDVTRHVVESDEWTVETNMVDTPDMDTRFTSKIPGRIEAGDATLNFYADVVGADARQVMPRDATGYIVWLDGGDVPGRKMAVFPVTVASHSFERSAEGDDAATFEAAFAITSEPVLNITIPA